MGGPLRHANFYRRVWVPTLAKADLPGIRFQGMNGEYMDKMEQVSTFSTARKIVLFMGANIGNMTLPQATLFCRQTRGDRKAKRETKTGKDGRALARRYFISCAAMKERGAYGKAGHASSTFGARKRTKGRLA